jgi:phosphohistidine phosphatase
MTSSSGPADGSATVARRLLVLRHADSAAAGPPESPAGLPDQDRPLRHTGQWQATWIGRHATERGWRPEIAIASPAVRAQQTLEAFCAGGAHTPQRRADPSLYQGGRDALTDVVAALPDRLSSALLVGHNPAVSGFVLGLVGDDARRFPLLSDGMRPGMLAVLEWAGDWNALEAATLVDVVWAGRHPA